LADDRLDIGKTAHTWMQGSNVAVADGRQGHKPEVDEIARNGEVTVKQLGSLNATVRKQITGRRACLRRLRLFGDIQRILRAYQARVTTMASRR
jgi:hypothetical protein